MALDNPLLDRLPPNQARGSLDDMDDDVAGTDQISTGPVLSRLLTTMRFEHRAPPSEDSTQTNGASSSNGDITMTNGDVPNGISHESEPATNGDSNKPRPLPSSTTLPENVRQSGIIPNLSTNQLEERLKGELRHIGFLPADEEPEFDAHNDDEVAERLRWLQARLKQVSILNGARKRRVLELAEEQLAYQEYSTILEDLDGQVQQAYLKRARTAGKSKKNAKRPGGSGVGGGLAGTAGAGGANGVGVAAKPGIGDLARQLMNRRARWEEKIGPVFRGDVRRVRGSGEGIFGEKVLEPLKRMENDMFEEENE